MLSPSNAPERHAWLVRELAELPDGERRTRAVAHAHRDVVASWCFGPIMVFAAGCGSGGPPVPAQPPSVPLSATPAASPVASAPPPVASSVAADRAPSASSASSALSSPAPAEQSVPPACRGNDLDVDRLAKKCGHERPDETAPGPEKLRIVLELPPQGIRSGNHAATWLRFINASPAPLLLQLNASCLDPFETRIVDAQNVRVDLEETMGGLGLCSTTPGVRVLLDAGGRLSKRLEVSARAQRWVENPKTGTFTLAPSSPIAPGTYTLVVDLPLLGNPRLGQPERLEVTGALKITPR